MTARFLTTIVLCLTSLQVTAQDSLLHQSTAADAVPWEEVFDLLEMLDDDGKATLGEMRVVLSLVRERLTALLNYG